MQNTQDPEAAETAQTTQPEAVAPSVTCSPLLAAINGYMENRLSLVKSLGAVSYVYGQNGHAKSKEISEEIARIDSIVGDLVSSENDQEHTPK